MNDLPVAVIAPEIVLGFLFGMKKEGIRNAERELSARSCSSAGHNSLADKVKSTPVAKGDVDL